MMATWRRFLGGGSNIHPRGARIVAALLAFTFLSASWQQRPFGLMVVVIGLYAVAKVSLTSRDKWTFFLQNVAVVSVAYAVATFVR